ncbi:hypothetical protein [Rhodanobacter umsongensis]
MPDRPGFKPVTTTIPMAGTFCCTEDEHTRYLSGNLDGYCGRTGQA